MARDIRIALVGFGNVGRRFAERLRGAYARALRGRGAGARRRASPPPATASPIDPRGLDLGRALRLVAKRRLARRRCTAAGAVGDVRDFIARVPADVLIEITTLDPRSGQPAIAHVRQALAPRAARRHREQGTRRLRPAAAAGARRAQGAALPPRGRRDGRDAGLQPGGALPARARASSPFAARSTAPPTWCSRAWRKGLPASAAVKEAQRARHRRGRPAERPRRAGTRR